MTEPKHKQSAAELAEALAAPTPPEEVHFFPQALIRENTDSPKALCVPYFTRQFVEDRLDSAAGPFNWQSEVGEKAGVMVYGIGIRDPESAEWVWKWDTGVGDDNDGAKVSATGGIKRTGRLWGIGRDVARLVGKWKDCTVKDRRGKKVFNSWVEPPTLAEIKQYTAWIRKQGRGEEDEEEMGQDTGGATEAGNGSGPTGTDDERIGKSPPSQFWHLARSLMKEGHITESKVNDIIVANRGGDGKTDFVGARADLDEYVPVPEPAETEETTDDEIPF